ncbi:AsnC family transcriptional regulator [Salinarchaeum chitinilyticum]
MPQLDDTDLEILRLLVANARRPYSEIADKVGVSPPTVSDRIDRLQELGVIRRFTLDVDRSTLDAGIQVLIDVSTAPGTTEEVAESLAAQNVVEHVYATADGSVVAHATVPEDAVHDVLEESVANEHVESFDVRLLTDEEWTPEVAGTAFALECAVCGDEITSQGETARIDGEFVAFCSASCREAYAEEEQLAAESI